MYMYMYIFFLLQKGMDTFASSPVLGRAGPPNSFPPHRPSCANAGKWPWSRWRRAALSGAAAPSDGGSLPAAPSYLQPVAESYKQSNVSSATNAAAVSVSSIGINVCGCNFVICTDFFFFLLNRVLSVWISFTVNQEYILSSAFKCNVGPRSIILSISPSCLLITLAQEKEDIPLCDGCFGGGRKNIDFNSVSYITVISYIY